MPDWTKSMQQTYEYYKVDPESWADDSPITCVISSTISWDDDSDTLGSATLDVTEDVGECYIRIYLVTIQNGYRERFPLGTFLVQTPTSSFNGRHFSETLDAYTPLIELKENYPDFGYSVLKGVSIMDVVSTLCDEHMRAPVIRAKSDKTLLTDFVSEASETWLQFLTALMTNAHYKFELDPLSRVLFSPIQDMASLRHVWVYDDGNSSILYPEVSLERDLYGIPNVVEIIYSKESYYLYAKAVNDDPNSPVSTVSRGRTITYRETDPDIAGIPNKEQLEDYAVQLLRNLSSLEHSITYSHGYCPVRIGDCVLLNYTRAGLHNVAAIVKRQSIECWPGCCVEETAVYTVNVGSGYKVESKIDTNVFYIY